MVYRTIKVKSNDAAEICNTNFLKNCIARIQSIFARGIFRLRREFRCELYCIIIHYDVLFNNTIPRIWIYNPICFSVSRNCSVIRTGNIHWTSPIRRHMFESGCFSSFFFAITLSCTFFSANEPMFCENSNPGYIRVSRLSWIEYLLRKYLDE